MVASLAVPTAAAAGPAPDEPPSAGVVGDSIAHKARADIESVVGADRPIALLDTGDAVVIEDVEQRTIEAVSGPGGPDILVLVLGTAQANATYWPFPRSAVGAQWESDLRNLLAQVTPHVTCVRVFTIQERDTGFYLGVDRYAPEMNAVTRRVVGEFANADYFHYSVWADRTGPEYDWGDGLHHNGAGRRAVARLVDDVVDGCDPATAGDPFWDVAATHWAVAEIAWMAEAGLATGYDNDSYRAEVDRIVLPVSRGQVISMLWHLADEPAGVPPHQWTDGRPWVDDALDWAWSSGLAAGFADGSFRPGADITRAQVARMIWRLAGEPPTDHRHGWSDGRPWVDPALDWIDDNGLMTGWDDGTFRPDESISRAAIARLLFRFDALPPAPAPPAPAATAPPPTTTTTAPPPTTTPTTTTGFAGEAPFG